MIQKTIQHTLGHSLHEHILKICHSLALPLHYNRKGPKVFTNYQRVAMIILYIRSRKSLRDFIAEIYESKWPQWLDLREIPSKSVLNNWVKLFDMNFLRNFSSKILAKEEPKLMAIDATGIDSWRRSRHYERRIGEPYMPYAKADLLVDTKTKIIHDFVLRIKPRHDVLGAATIIKRLGSKNVTILADRGYDSEPLHRLTIQSGNTLFAPIRDFNVKKPKGKNRRRCAEGNPLYSMRNIVESVNHALKARLGALRSKKHFNKKREFAWHIIIYNIQRINKATKIYLFILQRVFWTRPKISLLIMPPKEKLLCRIYDNLSNPALLDDLGLDPECTDLYFVH
jgi:hypothetical protein